MGGSLGRGPSLQYPSASPEGSRQLCKHPLPRREAGEKGAGPGVSGGLGTESEGRPLIYATCGLDRVHPSPSLCLRSPPIQDPIPGKHP